MKNSNKANKFIVISAPVLTRARIFAPILNFFFLLLLVLFLLCFHFPFWRRSSRYAYGDHLIKLILAKYIMYSWSNRSCSWLLFMKIWILKSSTIYLTQVATNSTRCSVYAFFGNSKLRIFWQFRRVFCVAQRLICFLYIFDGTTQHTHTHTKKSRVHLIYTLISSQKSRAVATETNGVSEKYAHRFECIEQKKIKKTNSDLNI